MLDKKLSGLKWITPFYQDNPKKEILLLKEAINKIDNDNRKKIIITDYQFISVVLSLYDYSPSQVWYSYHVNPIKGSKYFKIHKKFFIEKFLLIIFLRKKTSIKTIKIIGINEPRKISWMPVDKAPNIPKEIIYWFAFLLMFCFFRYLKIK